MIPKNRFRISVIVSYNSSPFFSSSSYQDSPCAGGDGPSVETCFEDSEAGAKRALQKRKRRNGLGRMKASSKGRRPCGSPAFSSWRFSSDGKTEK